MVKNCSSLPNDENDYETRRTQNHRAAIAQLDGTQAVIFKFDTVKQKRYQWIQNELVRFDYMRISKADKGIIKRYLVKVSSYSRAQVTRLIKQYTLAISNINRR